MRGIRRIGKLKWRRAGALLIVLLAGAALLVGAGWLQEAERAGPPPLAAQAEPRLVTPTPTPTTVGKDDRQPAAMPVHGDCLACHGGNGGPAMASPPPLAHPIEGWTQCTACHTRDGAAPVANGHEGIDSKDCLVCHKTSAGPAPAIPHPSTDAGCSQCHGTKMPLPQSHAGRSDTTCWLCHREADVEAPQIPHAVQPNTACRSCHTDGQVGALPADHASRDETTCTLCHSPLAGGPPVMPHALQPRSAYCAFCHAQASTQ